MIKNKIKFLSRSQFLLIFFLFLCLSSQNEVLNKRNLQEKTLIRTSSSLPSTFDWRQKTSMTSVKDQKDCNAYYAFSTIAFFEQDLIINQGQSADIDLSEQFLTKCLSTGGCIGGSPKDAMQLVLKKGGIPTQSKYPYSPWDNSDSDICYPSQLVKVGDRPMYSFYNINDQQFLKSLILKQPLNIYICSSDLKLYGPKSNSDRTLYCKADNINNDHTVLLVGYTETQWIIKNSWGTGWGINGYGYISRKADNDCCIGSQVYLRGSKTQTKTCKIQNCQTCIQETYCSKCKPGYYVSSKDNKHICVQCTLQNCAECQNSLGYCRTCIYGYALYFPEKTCKISMIQNCKNIVNGGCKQCHNGYKVTKQFTCVRECSIVNCETCKDDKSCSKCISGYELIIENKTLICKQNKCRTENCAACDEKGKCVDCKGSYTLVQDSCVMKCDKKNCQKCSETQNVCEKCNQGYALDYYSHQCAVVNVKNCKEVYLTKYCSICEQGYLRSDSWLSCDKICNVQNCQTCQVGRSNQCVSCKQGYQLTNQGGFSVCQKNKCTLKNCLLCNFGSDTCLQCIDKYHRWSAIDNACIPYKCHLQNCNKCQTDSKKCQQCKDQTILFIPSGGCMQSKIQNCQALGMTNDKIQCWDCKQGYQVDYKSWEICKKICIDQNCIQCQQDSKVCKTCLQGYGLKILDSGQTKCIKIAVYLPHCLRANSQQTFCYQCKQFYYFNNKTLNCQLNGNCPQNCIKCTDTSNKQINVKCQCKSGMVWDFINKQCVKNPTDSKCLVISNYTGNQQCFQCKDRYTLTDDGKGCILDCAVQNCDICVHSVSQNYPDYCKVCINGYIVTPNMTKCVPCQVQNCDQCKSYDQRKICNRCKLGYQLKSDGNCKQIQCQQHAVFNGLQCACENSYYKEKSSSGEICKMCDTACRRCTGQSNCIQCAQGYFLQSATISNKTQSKCSACIENCQKCQDSTTCKACQQGFTYQLKKDQYYCIQTGLGNQGFTQLPGGGKVRCMAGCSACIQDYKTCQQCMDGYILINKICQKCQQNCKSCYTNILSACKTCQLGYALTQQGKCVKCTSQNCLNCPNSPGVCIQCIQGFYLKDQKCKACDRGCKICNKNGTCLETISGFVLIEGGFCQQCIDGCSKCKAQTLHTCQSGCVSGTYLTQNNTCAPCPSTCRTCQSDNKCTKCITGYNLFQDKCDKWCDDSNCYECQDKPSICKQCYAGYKLKSVKQGICIPDLDCNLITKQNTQENGTCEVCPKKYYLESGTNLCQQCQFSDDNCIQCQSQNPTNCTLCTKGYYLQSTICIKCQQSCLSCRSKDFCYLCSQGYYMIQKDKQYSGKCIKCSNNCLTCLDQPTKCLTCQQGYQLSVARICMNMDKITFVIRLNLIFEIYFKKARIFKIAFNMLYKEQGYFHTQYKKIYKGSTVLQGYVSIPSNQKGTQTYKNLVEKIRRGNQIAGIPVQSVTLKYDGNTYISDETNDNNIENNDSIKIEGWVIAVAVVCGVVGLILIIAIIIYIKKKVSASRNDNNQSEDVLDSEGKQTQSNFKKNNPQLIE